MKICLDFDDFSVLNNRLDLLLRLKETYPKLKVSLFTIPYDYAFESKVAGRILRKRTLKAIKKELDWLELIPHGLVHMPREFEKADRKTMEMVLPAIDEAFKRDDLPYVKGFKAPFWLWNQDVIDVLDEEGWWGAVDPKQKMLKTKKYYEYSHGIDEPYMESTNKVLKLHGHITPTKNGIEKCFVNLFKMPADAEFKFASEMVET